MDETVMKKFLRAVTDDETPETPEQKAEREKKAEEDRLRWEKHKRDQEEAIRLAVPRKIETLRKEAAEKVAEASKLEALLKEFPDLRMHTDRWRNNRFYSKTVNTRLDRFEIKHSCGCCNDSSLLIYPYLDTPHGRVYSDPTDFRVGHKEPLYGGDVPTKGWDTEMRNAGIPEPIIGAVKMHFKREAAEAKEAAASIYDQESDDSEPEPFV